MENKEILNYIDHTQLKAFATWKDVESLCEEAARYGTASVCIPQSFIKRVKEKYQDKIVICTVIGFPLGYNSTHSKVVEAQDAIADGAEEIDTVVNIGDVKDGRFEEVKEELMQIRKATEGKILKVIIETCYLTEEEKIRLCEIVTEVKADFIKTSTGFGTAGATVEDVALFAQHIGPDVKIKAAGGIRTIEDAQKMIAAGAGRIGSSAVAPLIGAEYNM